MAIQKQKVQFFQDAVLDFFAKSGREELPWRTKGIGAYEVWVSEIMLQQTQVSRVLTYYTRFLQRFPTVLDLAAATWEDFLPYYEGLGYYNRGRNMLRTAVMVRDSFKGAFPKTREELLVLPGVGEYTAAAILSFAYNQDALAWDTNLKRVMGRFFFGVLDPAIARVGRAGAELRVVDDRANAVVDRAGEVVRPHEPLPLPDRTLRSGADHAGSTAADAVAPEVAE